MVASHDCTHEELIQDHSLQLTELNTKAQYKEQAIMELKDELKEMNTKIDAINNNVNKLILNSETNDSQIEKRIETLETKIKVYEEFFKELKEDQDKRTKNLIAIFAVIATVIGIIVRFI